MRDARMHRPAARSCRRAALARCSPAARCIACATCTRKGRARRNVDQGHPRSQGKKPARRYPLSLSQPSSGRQGRAPESCAVRAFRHVRQRADARGQRQTDPRQVAKALDHRDATQGHGSHGPNQCYYWTEPELGVELSRMVNNRLAEIVATWPERFVALGTVPLQHVDLAVAELERCVKQLGLRGVEINPSVNGMDLTDPRLKLEKLFAKAQALDVIIFMHPIGFTQGERLIDHYFNDVIGNPMETTIAASHLIFDGVMQRHPKLKIVLPHAGGYLAHYWARMDHGHRARPDCRTVIKRPPSYYLAKMYFDTITFDPEMLRHMIGKYGPGHVLLGTDYPYDMGEEDPLGLIGSVRGLKRADRDMIEGGNAARLLKIER
ncbi:MAG: amidohydrolase [Betaproteobacteria bacterium]|nr:MAG: amidohydrolase [Betaproteobacteria bacterium]